MILQSAFYPAGHSTIFPPYFVAGAILSGCAMVVVILSLLRQLYGLESIINEKHYEKLAKVMIAMSQIITYAYIIEFFAPYYYVVPFETDNTIEISLYVERLFGKYSLLFSVMLIANVILPQLFWFRKIRNSIPVILIISVLINIGMWLERYIIVCFLTGQYIPE